MDSFQRWFRLRSRCSQPCCEWIRALASVALGAPVLSRLVYIDASSRACQRFPLRHRVDPSTSSALLLTLLLVLTCSRRPAESGSDSEAVGAAVSRIRFILKYEPR